MSHCDPVKLWPYLSEGSIPDHEAVRYLLRITGLMEYCPPKPDTAYYE